MDTPPASIFGRIAELDALRGFAVIGIVLMNVFAFAMPPAAYYNPAAYGGTAPAELGSWALGFVLVEDKFRNLFAMMFGTGVAILLERERQYPLRKHYARMAVLFVFGFLHALLLSSSDVLRLYALCGLVLPLAVRWPVKRLLFAAAALVALHMAVGGYIAWGWLEYWWRFATVPGTGFAPLMPAEAAFGADPDAIARGLETGREALGERVAARLANPAAPLLAGLAILPLTLAAMLAGIAMLRSGLIVAQWPVARLRRFGFRLTGLALPPLAALAAFAFHAGFNGAVIGTNALVWSAPFDLLLGTAWACLAMAGFQSQAGSALVARLAATGRMALTNYLASSLVLGGIFAGWGLGLFGEVGRLEAYAIALVPITLMLLLSPLWLARFRQGPAEWLWRGLANCRFAPLRR
ncbi:MAG TPA: DUF418 domain-containing protein [Sphingomonadaceae bacterium]|nr:DUF418 domain-containing protein [Sphingomonadaceae bacterium]